MKNKLVKKVFAVVMAAAVMAGNGVTTDVFAAPVATVFDATPTDGTEAKPADKGTELKDTTSKGEYTVTNADKGTVSYDGTTSKSSTVKIPSTIEVDGVKYKVTTIDDGALYLSDEEYFPQYVKAHIDRGSQLLLDMYNHAGNMDKYILQVLGEGDTV